jgi:hypothetical protein
LGEDHGLGVALFISEPPNAMQVSMHLSMLTGKKTHTHKSNFSNMILQSGIPKTKDFKLLLKRQRAWMMFHVVKRSQN